MINNDAIMLGVVSGVIAGILLQFLITIFNKILAPWYQQIVYKWININGEWHASNVFENGNISDSVYQISQKAMYIDCTISMIERTQDGNLVYQKAFKASGYIKDRLVSLQSHNDNKKQIGEAVHLFEIKGDGSEMKGFEAWYSVSRSEVISKSVKVIRKNT